MLFCLRAPADGLGPDALGVIFNRNDPASARVAAYYAAVRHVPAQNVVGLPADTVGWPPAMLLPSGDETLARAVIDRGVRADGSRPAGTVYLVRTQDFARNVRAAGYADTESLLGNQIAIREATTPVAGPVVDILAYFTGAVRGDTLLEAYWKSVAMPGQGLFIGEPLARPFDHRSLSGRAGE